MKNQAEVHDLLLEIAATITKLANAIGEDDLHGKSHYDEWYEKLKQDEAAMRSEVQTDRELLSPYITPSPGPFYTPTTPRPMKPLMVDELGEAAAYHWREARELRSEGVAVSSEKLPCPFKEGDIVRVIIRCFAADVGDVGVVTRTRDGVINEEPGAGSCPPRVWVQFTDGATCSADAIRFERH